MTGKGDKKSQPGTGKEEAHHMQRPRGGHGCERRLWDDNECSPADPHQPCMHEAEILAYMVSP